MLAANERVSNPVGSQPDRFHFDITVRKMPESRSVGDPRSEQGCRSESESSTLRHTDSARTDSRGSGPFHSELTVLVS